MTKKYKLPFHFFSSQKINEVIMVKVYKLMRSLNVNRTFVFSRCVGLYNYCTLYHYYVSKLFCIDLILLCHGSHSNNCYL